MMLLLRENVTQQTSGKGMIHSRGAAEGAGSSLLDNSEPV